MQRLCLVVPCFNEERRLDTPAFERFMDAHPGVSFCLVDDGSGDRTRQILDGMARARPDSVRVLALATNGGKAEAVRRGMLEAHAWKPFDFIGYWDADLSTPLSELPALVAAAAAVPGCQLVLGSRVRRLGATIERLAWRHYLGRVFATAASLILGLAVYDTQCGAKLVRADLAPALFEAPFVSRWAFDVELIARLRRLSGGPALLAATVEVPLGEWRHRSGSKLTPGAITRVPLELWRIARRYGVGGGEH